MQILQKEEEIKRKQEEKRSNEEEDRAQLLNTFDSIAPEVVYKILALTDGDVDKATEQLLDIFQKQEEDKEEMDLIQKERDSMISQVQSMFTGLPDSTIREIFEKNEWNLKKSIAPLISIWEEKEEIKRKEQAERKMKEREEIISRLSSQHQLEPEIVSSILASTNWDEQKANLLC